jgi:uncharacterized surface protein with fasciclin (FAS1) repeats
LLSIEVTMKTTRPLAAAAACLLGMTALPALAQPASPAPPAAAPAPAPIPPAGAPFKPIAPAGDVLATLEASGEFKIFVQAIQATNLAQIFKTQPNITVFAPPDSAFSSLPGDQLAALQKNIPALQKLVTYHLVNTHITSAQVIGHAATSIPSVANIPLSLSGEGGKMTVNGANVIQPDVMATNGVIFVIDQVLQPAGAPPPAPAAPAPAPATPAPAAH